MRILNGEEIRQAEGEALTRPEVSSLVLIQRAGYAVAQFCMAHFKFRRVCVVCGAGKNGAYGLAAAEALRRIVEEVHAIVLAGGVDELSPDMAAVRARLGIEPAMVADAGDLEKEKVSEALEADLIIDAIADAGSGAPPNDVARKAIECVNRASGVVVSLDLPAGADGDSRAPLHERGPDVVLSHGIIAFIAPRPAHVFGNLTSGPIAVSELGVQPVLVTNKTGLSVVTGQEAAIAFPPRPQDAHKGTFGHVLVIAGSLGKAGAAGLAGLSALRTGAGLVTVACPKSIQAMVAGFAPELMTEGLAETADGSISMEASDKTDALLAGKSVVVVGPGLSGDEQTAKFVRRLVTQCPLPLALDADGLNAFAGNSGELKRCRVLRVLTPHPGEAGRLLGVSTEEINADRATMARRIADETGACVALKGSRTVVAGVSGETWINMTGNPALAKGGSGDVLSGIIGATLARNDGRTGEGISAFRNDMKVAAAVYLHGLTGDLARDELHENTVVATDLLKSLAEAFRECELQSDRGMFYLQR